MKKARTRIKICGVTRPEDAILAAELGADAVGLVFYPPAPAAVTIAQAAEIARVLPPFVSAAALFVRASAEFIGEVIDAVRPQILQFHGGEDAKFCGQFSQPYIFACRVRESADIIKAIESHPSARAILLDSFSKDSPGGSGRTFDWNLIPPNSSKPLILAGGLTPQNVGAAVRSARPFAVDVASGVRDDENPRRKNPDKIRAFIEEVKNADES